MTGLFLLLISCKPPAVPWSAQGPQVRYRPLQHAPGEDGQWLMDVVPTGTWDAGLAEASQALLAGMTSRTAILDPHNTNNAADRAGFPGQARFARLLNGGAYPEELVDEIFLSVGDAPVDLGLSRRTYSDGTALWVLGWAEHFTDVDPLPLTMSLDDTLAITLHPTNGWGETRLFVDTPSGTVDEIAITPMISRWIDSFHTPGNYRFEVVINEGSASRVALLFSVFVDSELPAPPRLSEAKTDTPNPHLAAEWLYKAVNSLRSERDLAPLQRFDLFEPLAREHASFMASAGVIAHTIPGVTSGVPNRAANFAHPRAVHLESVAAASTAEEALLLVKNSPGHLRTLLCSDCTHISIGTTLEPTLDRIPRLFVTWEVLAFPQGPPKKIDHYNR